MRWVGLLLVLLSLGVAEAKPPAHVPITADGIGPVHVGATEAELKALGLPMERSFDYDDDIEVVFYTLVIDGRVKVGAIRRKNEAAVYAVVASDPAIITPSGAHVGMTLGRLRRLYPYSSIVCGVSDSNFLDLGIASALDTSAPPERVLFRFDPGGVDYGHLEKNRCPPTPELDAKVSVGVRVQAYQSGAWVRLPHP